MLSCWIIILWIFSLNFKIVFGQCDNVTAPLTLNAAPYPQYFVSPNYPNDYDDNMDCYWVIQAPASDDRVIINIHETNLMGRSGCTADYINLYDGATNTSAHIATVCDQNDQTYNIFVSNGSALYFWFHSDDSNTTQGFRVLYFSNSTANQQSGCSGSPLVATSTLQYLMSPNLPDLYPSDYNCTTFVEASTPFYTLNFTLYLLDVEETNKCTNDLFYVSEGTNTSVMTTVADSILCTTAFTYDFTAITTQYSTAAITLQSDSASTNYYGYFLGYQQVQVGINLTYPVDGQTVELTLPEDEPVGVLNDSDARIDVTSEGVISMTVLQDGSATSLDFTYNTDSGQYLIELLNTLDYEANTSHVLTFIIAGRVDPTELTQGRVDPRNELTRGRADPESSYYMLAYYDVYPSISGTVYFKISITDVDDNIPQMTNLPANATVYRSQAAGYSVFNVASTDADVTAAYQVPAYMIFSGNSDGLLQIDLNSGEITLANAASIISVSVTSYVVTIAAFSVSVNSGLASFNTFSLYFHPDDPPVCSHVTAWADSIGSATHGSGTVVSFSSPWSCSDEGNIVYSLTTVSPVLVTPLFSMNNASGEVTLTRSFTIAEVPSRQFNLTVTAEDFLGQTTSFHIVINVTTLTCTPNPKKIYARMGSDIGSTVESNFNCSSTEVTYAIKSQQPPGTFGISGSSIVVLTEVYKIRYYSLVLEVSDGSDTIDLTCSVTIRMKQCRKHIESNAVTLTSSNWLIIAMILSGKGLSSLVT